MNVEAKSARGTRDLEARAQVFAALGDPARLAIVELLRDQDMAPHALGAALDIPSNLLAHHVRVLEAASLVTRTRSQGDGRRSYVSLNQDAVDGLLDAAAEINAKRVVFVCTKNSARSILAEAIWAASSDIPVTSAGTHPVEAINPRTRKAASRAHLTIVRDTPALIEQVLRPDDLLISVCDGVNEELPKLSNRRLHWSVPDPVREGTDAAFNQVVQELTQRIESLAPRVHAPRARKATS